MLFVIRAQLRRQPRWWLAAGLVVGLSMYNKLLVAILLVAVVAGLMLFGPRRALWSRWVLAAAVLALVVGAPNLVYQATHGWPQLSMGRALAEHNAGEVRVQMWPFLLLILGPLLVPIWIAGIVGLVRRPEWRQVRFLAAAFPVLLALVFAMGAQFYYPFGLLAVLYAAGCVPAAEWMSGWRRNLVIAEVYATLPPADRAYAVIIASNYGEAGAVDRYGHRYLLPTVYSGQNQLYYQGRPPASATVVVFVGGQLGDVRGRFQSCVTEARLDNGLDVDNEEQGESIAVCRAPIGGWTALWPALRHED